MRLAVLIGLGALAAAVLLFLAVVALYGGGHVERPPIRTIPSPTKTAP